jgi:hypothetical protein
MALSATALASPWKLPQPTRMPKFSCCVSDGASAASATATPALSWPMALNTSPLSEARLPLVLVVPEFCGGVGHALIKAAADGDATQLECGSTTSEHTVDSNQLDD